ncbi:unnamed protein product, partial [Phaeothamnion confervicola]
MLRRVLVAWLAAEPQSRQYRQGLDLLAAPLLAVLLSRRDPNRSGSSVVLERRASALLDRVVTRHAGRYFSHGVTADIAFRASLSTIVRVLRFWDPELALRVWEMELVPELFAMPWLVTLFADTLTLPDTCDAWDLLLPLGPACAAAAAAALLCSPAVRGPLLAAASLEDALVFISALNGGAVAVDVRWVVLRAMVLYAETP